MVEHATRTRILAEARELLVAHGAAGVTMRGVALRVGVTPMALYRYFASREELLDALVEQGHATFLRYLGRALAEATPAARLAAAGEQYLRFALDHPQSYAVMFTERAAPLAGGNHGKWEEVATFRFLVDRIRDSAQAGDLEIDDAEGDAEDVALTVWAQVHGLVSLFLAGKLEIERAAFEAVYMRSIGALFRAFGARSEPAARMRNAPRRARPSRPSTRRRAS